ncbi:hypothetical protein A33M_1388 [Rhodovulum sp. PH10]|uniref:hypothetical protein n=1 Tax=Rhodovulum sp. PH10 TaxID=1187851 RepID=UPI00027C1F53|nr:hypothetical protein [Rhodovulum sp. PH10]EJW09389.1 hypothetical protein A33M_1388 [Rhodovulum sp. PH10]
MNQGLIRYRTAALDIAVRRTDRSTYSERMTVLIWAMLADTFVTLLVSTVFGAGTETTRAFVMPLAAIGAVLGVLVILEFAKLVTGVAR